MLSATVHTDVTFWNYEIYTFEKRTKWPMGIVKFDKYLGNGYGAKLGKIWGSGVLVEHIYGIRAKAKDRHAVTIRPKLEVMYGKCNCTIRIDIE